jgi:DNA repair protein RecN (Recombination protein N)
MTAAGKSAARINGAPVPLSALKSVGTALLNIHGQHDAQTLLNPAQHMRYVDALADNAPLREAYNSAFLRLRQKRAALKTLCAADKQKEERVAALETQIAELRRARIVPGEIDALHTVLRTHRNSEKLSEALRRADTALSGTDGTDGATDLARNAASALRDAGAFFAPAAACAARLEALCHEISDCAAETAAFQGTADIDPAAALAAQERLDLNYHLGLKYGEGETRLCASLAAAEAALNALQDTQDRIETLQTQVETAIEDLVARAKQLSRSRRGAAAKFQERVCAELAALDMPGAVFTAQITKTPLTENGGEEIVFLLSVNMGEAPKPLSKIASGGELSRIMLAIKAVLAEADGVGTLVFDEADSGVSGGAAQKIALKMKEVARHTQVLCVTHLAQVAAQADTHLFVEKRSENGRTYTHVVTLDPAERAAALARIMATGDVTPAQLAAAEEMLAR